MKTTNYCFLYLTIFMFLLFVIAGCRKEKENIDWLHGLTGKFALSTILPYSIYSMNANGIRKLTADTSSNLYSSVKWSPDGSKIIFVAGINLYIMNADGSDKRVIPGIVGYNPDWAPDGTKIVFQNGDYSGSNDSIYIVNTNGSGLLTMTKGYYPCWSSDGSQIYFYNSKAVWNINLSDHLIHKLADMPPMVVFYFIWSPDRTKIFYIDSGYEIFMINVKGGGLVRLNSIFSNIRFPDGICWSPDGTKIAYVIDYRCESPGLYVMNADESNIIQLTSSVWVSNVLLDGFLFWVDWH